MSPDTPTEHGPANSWRVTHTWTEDHADHGGEILMANTFVYADEATAKATARRLQERHPGAAHDVALEHWDPVRKGWRGVERAAATVRPRNPLRAVPEVTEDGA